MRLTKKVFSDLAVYMIGFGLFIGIVFPFFMLLLGIPSGYVITLPFFLSCMIAGVLVGTINIILARTVVGRRINNLSGKMKFISDKLDHATTLTDLEDCASADCRISEDSEDELGEGARSFNSLVAALSNSIASESAVRSFNKLLSSKMEVEPLTKHALDYILAYVQAEAGAILLERGGVYEIPYSFGITSPEILTENPNVWKVIESHQPYRRILQDQLSIDSTLISFRPADVVAYPLLYKDISLGLLVAASSTVFADRVLQTLEMFVQNLSLAVKNAVTYGQLQKLAANDALTGLYNRRFGMIRLSEEFTRSVKTHFPIGLLMFDLDHFKKVNDTYGHTIGDRVLVNLAKITNMAVRKGDVAVRCGGEEFVVILPGAAKKDCLFVAERLRHMVEESVVQFGDISVRVTVSIGAVSYPEYNIENEQELLNAADKAMYQAKEQGRNMVVSF